MQENREKRTKDDMIESYRDYLHRIAVSDTLIEANNWTAMAEQIATEMSDLKYINLKEEKDMKTTAKVFLNKTTNKIMED